MQDGLSNDATIPSFQSDPPSAAVATDSEAAVYGSERFASKARLDAGNFQPESFKKLIFRLEEEHEREIDVYRQQVHKLTAHLRVLQGRLPGVDEELQVITSSDGSTRKKLCGNWDDPDCQPALWERSVTRQPTRLRTISRPLRPSSSPESRSISGGFPPTTTIADSIVGESTNSDQLQNLQAIQQQQQQQQPQQQQQQQQSQTQPPQALKHSALQGAAGQRRRTTHLQIDPTGSIIPAKDGAAEESTHDAQRASPTEALEARNFGSVLRTVMQATNSGFAFGKGRKSTQLTPAAPDSRGMLWVLEQSQSQRSGGRSDRWMISPVSNTRLIWDIVALLAFLVDMWITTFELVYLQQGIILSPFQVVSTGMTAFWSLDMCLNFNTGFILKDRLVMQRGRATRRYFSKWFWVDLVATIPYEYLVSAAVGQFDPSALSLTRMTRITKVIKTLRFLKLIRAVRLVRSIQLVRNFQEAPPPFFIFVAYILQLLGMLALMSHIHACILAALEDDMRENSFGSAMQRYYESFRWAFNLIALGATENAQGEERPFRIYIFEMVTACERLVAATIFGGWAVTKAITILHEEMRFKSLQLSAMRFFRHNNLSVETQIQVVYSLLETRAAQIMQRNFKQLMSENVPEELRRAVSEELWTPNLMSLGLIVQVKDWHEGFLGELSLLVREEVFASKTILCKDGSSTIAAYYVINGRLTIVNSSWYRTMPDFTNGMWVGESSFLTPLRERRGTIIVRLFSRLMMVPSQGFHQLMTRMGLMDRFKSFQETHLARGLCGRCGEVGDHFTHACPQVGPQGGLTFWMQQKNQMPQGWRYWRDWLQGKTQRVKRSITKALVEVDDPQKQTLHTFLHSHGLLVLKPFLDDQNVNCIADISQIDFEQLMEATDYDQELLSKVDLLHSLQEETNEVTWDRLAKDTLREQHLLFLSHFKQEAGTEAALMRTEIELQLKSEGGGDLYEHFNTPTFLDSEDLADLAELEWKVSQSHNLILLLTNSVLRRPWVLVELVTAFRCGVRILPVIIVKSGQLPDFQVPTDLFYSRLESGQWLTKSEEDDLLERGITLQEVSDTLRKVFTRIAVPYSPHRPVSIRLLELKQILKQIRVKLVRLPPSGDLSVDDVEDWPYPGTGSAGVSLPPMRINSSNAGPSGSAGRVEELPKSRSGSSTVLEVLGGGKDRTRD